MRSGVRRLSEQTTDIYGHGKNVNKGKFYSPPRSKGAYNTNNAIDRTIHRHKRAVLGQGFSDAALRYSEPIILEHIRDFSSTLTEPSPTPDPDRQGWTSPKNLSRFAAYMTYDVISDLAFGESFLMLHKPDMRWIQRSFGLFSWRAQVTGQAPHLFDRPQSSWPPSLNLNLNRLFFSSIEPLTRQYTRLGLAMAVKRTDNAEAYLRKDIMSFLLAAKDPETGKGFSKHELWAESNLIIGAGQPDFAFLFHMLC